MKRQSIIKQTKKLPTTVLQLEGKYILHLFILYKYPKLSINKRINDIKRQFSEKETQITNKYFSLRATVSAMRGLLVKTTLRFHITAVRITITKKCQ